MAGRKVILIRPTVRAQVPSVDDEGVQRALDVLADAVQAIQDRRSREVVTYDLAIGTNRVPHNLGRAAAGYTLTPTVADSGFAHALDTSNPRPDLEVWITVLGAAQPGANVEVF